MQQNFLDRVRTERPFFVLSPALLWQLLFFYLPLLIMILMSFMSYSPDTGLSVSFARYLSFFKWSSISIIFRSTILASVTVILCFLLGYPLAYFLAFKAKKFKLFFLFLVILPFWTNFLLHIYAWFFVFDRVGIINNLLRSLGLISEPLHLLNSIFAIIVVMVYCYLPFMVVPIYATLERFDKTLLEASKDLGASRFETWYHVVIPLSASGVISGCFFVFVPAFGEFAIPSLMGGDRSLFVGSVIAQYALGGATMSYGIAFTVMSFCVVLLVVALGYGIRHIFLNYIKDNAGD
jgi:spermidine/putrescine transport system permease protein